MTGSVTSPRRRTSWLSALSWLYIGTMVSFTCCDRFFGDRLWWTLPIVFGPRWLLAIPVVIVTPLLLYMPTWRALLLIAVSFALNSYLLGAELLPRFTAGGKSERFSLRVVSCNTQGKLANLEALRSFVKLQRPDVIVLQEAPAQFELVWTDSAAPYFHTTDHLVILSRFAIEAESPIRQGESGRALAIRCRVMTPAGAMLLANVHLSSARDGLEALMAKKLNGAAHAQANIDQRESDSRNTSLALGNPQLPLVVAGDFNLPVHSGIFRDHWSRFRDAFSDAGWGLGYTKHTRSFGVRIDHVLFNDELRAVSSEVGPDVGSDHRPIVSELELRT